VLPTSNKVAMMKFVKAIRGRIDFLGSTNAFHLYHLAVTGVMMPDIGLENPGVDRVDSIVCKSLPYS